MKDHTVKAYDDELDQLDALIATMGKRVERMLSDAVEGLEHRNVTKSEEAVMADTLVDKIHREIEELSVSVIARRQPVGQDLRRIVGAMRVAVDLERIGDLGKNTAKRTLAISGVDYPKPLMTGLQGMFRLAVEQLRDVLDAYMARNAEKAVAVWNRDAEIDNMLNALFREYLTYMMEDPRNIGITTHLLFGAKNIERVGDHATNIAETVYYVVHGSDMGEQRPKADVTSSSLVSSG
ncbi:MAG: phosphate signaling complex protein PhoU [Hyphomicrobiaceae bacterium]